jgi:hypothetical protein
MSWSQAEHGIERGQHVCCPYVLKTFVDCRDAIDRVRPPTNLNLFDVEGIPGLNDKWRGIVG